jgi:hypothetical protein
MSGYGSLRKRMQQTQQEPERDPGACVALGCPCKGSVSMEGGGFTCTAHGAIPSDRWPMVSERLREHRWLIEFIDEMRKMDAEHGDWRGFAVQFWTEDQYAAPVAGENAIPYQLRMRGELMHRCGLLKNRPAPRLPKAPAVGRFGNAGGLLGSRT